MTDYINFILLSSLASVLSLWVASPKIFCINLIMDLMEGAKPNYNLGSRHMKVACCKKERGEQGDTVASILASN